MKKSVRIAECVPKKEIPSTVAVVQECVNYATANPPTWGQINVTTAIKISAINNESMFSK